MNFDEFLQPAIFGLTGKPGAGKSYFATRLIIAEITKGRNRPIVSNVPINKEKLRAYVKKDFYYYPLETYSDNKAFFTNRGYYRIPAESLIDSNIDFAPLLKNDDDGVLYVIDEAHLYFNARNWKHMPQGTISYITTIRHIGDSLIWMCQKFSDIDSQIRGKTQAFHLLRNLEKEKLGIFKRGSGFRCYQYLDEHSISSHGNITAQSSQDFTYKFNLKIAECYNTSLFNKSHDKKYRIKAIPLNYIVYAVVLLVIGGIYWVSQGGIRTSFNMLIPDMVVLEEEQPVQVIEQNITQAMVTLPPSDPFLLEANFNKEVPIYSFTTGDRMNKSGLQTFETELDYNQSRNIWFGVSRKCTLTFISDKTTTEKNFEFSFQAYWQKFASLNRVDLTQELGIWSMRSNYFHGFLTYIRENGKGANMKEVDLVIKENVPFTLKHGFQLPVQESVATQGVVRTSNSYMDVGFSLDLVLEQIEDNELLRVEVDNSDVMDLTSDSPILQKFASTNVLDVVQGLTYQIADFRSMTSQVNKGFLKDNEYSTEVTNKIFLTYGE